MTESNSLSLGILANNLSGDYEKWGWSTLLMDNLSGERGDLEKGYTGNILFIASTNIPKKVDPALIGPNK